MEEIEAVMIKVEIDDEYEADQNCQLEPEIELQEDHPQLQRRRGRPKKYFSPDNALEERKHKLLRKKKKHKKPLKHRNKNELQESNTIVEIVKTTESISQNNSDSDISADVEDILKLKKKKMKEANHVCTICPMRFTRFMDLERHVFHHTGIRNYSCNECGVKFITTNDLNKHRQSHATEAKFECSICPDKKFRTIMSLRAHMKLCHTDKEQTSRHLCTECGVTFRTASTLWMHKRRIHSDVRKFKCEICEKGFCKQMELTNHMKSHSDYREFKCDLCPAEYKKKITLLIHKTEKHGIGNHTKSKYNGYKNQACPYCEERFGLREHLQFHIRRNHTGVKPFQCCLCQKSFIRKGYVKDHLKRKHHMTTEQIAIGNYVISNETLLSNSANESTSRVMQSTESSGPTMPMIPLVLPEAIYENDSDKEDEDYNGRDRKSVV